MELTLSWECNRCERAQNRLIRFKNDEEVTGKKIQERKNKARYLCIYCRHSHTAKTLKKRPKVYYVQEGKATAQVNLEELR